MDKKKLNEFIDSFCVDDIVEFGEKVLEKTNKITDKCIDKIEETGAMKKVYDAFEMVGEAMLSGGKVQFTQC